MGLLTALAISIGVLGGLATFLFLGPLGTSGIQLWCVFLAWACFYSVGGTEKGIMVTCIQMIFGAFCGWAAFMVITHVPLAATLGLPAWAGICVGVSVVILVLAANVPILSVIPASVYGYAAIAAFFLLHTFALAAVYKVPGVLAPGDALTAASMENPLITIAVSTVVGSLFAYVSQKIGLAMNTAPAAVAAE